MLNFNPHTWFHLIQPHQEEQYIKNQLKLLKKEYTIIGSNSVLDKYTTKCWKIKNFEYYLAPSGYWAEYNRAEYFSIFNDYILTIKLDNRTTNQIEKLYRQTKDINNIQLDTIISFFNQPVKVKMTLEKNSKKADIYYKRFEKIFGPLEK